MSEVETVFGIHAVQSMLKTSADSISELWVLRGRQDQRVQKIIDHAKKARIKVSLQDKKKLDEVCDGNHQGVIVFAKPSKRYFEKDLESLINDVRIPLVLVLDGVTDPHNLGACMRSADAAGVNVVIIPKDNSAGLTDVAKKVACGAAETVPLISVTNLSRTLKKLQEFGLWVSGAAGEAEQTIYDADLRGPRAIVMGAEGTGLRRLTRETCDELVNIPMSGSVSSLNVSVATGVVLFEVVRQRLSE